LIKNTTTRAAALGVVALIGILLSGCSGDSDRASGSDSGGELSASSPEVRAALEDGEISRDEYDAAYRRFASCMDSGGAPLTEYPMEEDTYIFGYTDAAKQSGLYDDCYGYEFQGVDVEWQLAHPTVATRLATCLYLVGDSFVGTNDEMKDRLLEIGEDPDECLARKF
jgi:hypothetical protein